MLPLGMSFSSPFHPPQKEKSHTIETLGTVPQLFFWGANVHSCFSNTLLNLPFNLNFEIILSQRK